MATIRRIAFVGPIAYFGTQYFGKGLNGCRDVIRDRAQKYINGSIGVENVISVTEHAMTFGPFSVVVWFRDPNEEPKPHDPIDDELE